MADVDQETAWGAAAAHDVAVATVWEFAARSGAERVCVLLDRGDATTGVVVECEPGGDALVAVAGEEHVVPAAVVRDTPPLPLVPPRPVPATAIFVDPADGEVAAPLGAIAALGDGVLDLARVLGGRTVATADFPTASGMPLTIAAREGEPLVMQIDGRQFELAGS